MNFIKLLILSSILSIILNSCTSLSEAGKVLRNDKTRSSDEFLIKKKESLILPPNYDKIPEPGSIKNKAQSDKNRLENILGAKRLESSASQTKSTTTEESILRQIKK
tara:strand:+ start:227 stop:547 length:321 start_codon:yes stop_codon:yes gene_type:complete